MTTTSRRPPLNRHPLNRRIRWAKRDCQKAMKLLDRVQRRLDLLLRLKRLTRRDRDSANDQGEIAES
jgi:hypothetical protein